MRVACGGWWLWVVVVVGRYRMVHTISYGTISYHIVPYLFPNSCRPPGEKLRF